MNIIRKISLASERNTRRKKNKDTLEKLILKRVCINNSIKRYEESYQHNVNKRDKLVSKGKSGASIDKLSNCIESDFNTITKLKKKRGDIDEKVKHLLK